MTSYDVIVVGSGVIGLSVARQLASQNCQVALIDPSPGRGASYVAAGMLAPVTEASWGEEELVHANVRASTLWPDFAAELSRSTGFQLGYRDTGTLLVAMDRDDRSQLEELLEFQHHLGLESIWCPPSQCHLLEPLLSPAVAGGIVAPQDHQVDNRRLLGALDYACERAGVVKLRERVESISIANGGVEGVQTGHEFLRSKIVVVAAGVGSAGLAGLPAESLPPVRPVKGQIVRLRTKDSAPLFDRCVRGIVHGSSIYVVARSDGRLAVGATVEEYGTDFTVTVGGVYELLRDATRLLPGLMEIEFVEARAGLRPGSPDNAPLIGPGNLDGLIFATGHYRNGILLAPLTAQLIVGLIASGELPEWARVFDPQRFVQPGPQQPLPGQVAATIQ